MNYHYIILKNYSTSKISYCELVKTKRGKTKIFTSYTKVREYIDQKNMSGYRIIKLD